MDDDAVTRLLAEQSGVIARRQILELGGTDADIRRLVRRREWKRVHAGVYVDHTGALSWLQRAWAAVLVMHPAALTGWSALRAHRVRGADQDDREPVEVAVDESRRVKAPQGIRVRRVTAFDGLVQPNLSPPRLRLEHAALEVAACQRTDDAAVATLADICQTGRSTPQRLREALLCRAKLRRRRLLLEILDDVSAGAYSALERRYLARVERRHGLPTGSRQCREADGGRGAHYRDVSYADFETHVELDGRLGHEAAGDRWADLDRDLAGALTGHLTLRIGWRQVLYAWPR